MTKQFNTKPRYTAILRGGWLLTLGLLVSACGGGPSPEQSFEGTKTEVETVIKGEVRAGREVYKQGKLTVEDYKGQAVTAAAWSDSPKFAVKIPAGTLYPIVITAHADNGDGGHEMLKLVVANPTTSEQLVTPNTTGIAQKALEMGGYTPENITAAAMQEVMPPEHRGHH